MTKSECGLQREREP